MLGTFIVLLGNFERALELLVMFGNLSLFRQDYGSSK